jgi:rhodanese-related sulfurtransferase
VDELLEEARTRIAPRRSPAEAEEAARHGALLVDLRSRDERARHGVIPGSLHVPRSVLEWRADPDSGWTSPHLGDFDREVILFCAQGYSSSFAAATLRELGYRRATDLIGGFEGWRDSGLPVLRGSSQQEAEAGLPGMGDLEPPSF